MMKMKVVSRNSTTKGQSKVNDENEGSEQEQYPVRTIQAR